MHSDFEIEDGVLLSYSGESREVVIPDEVRELSSTVFYERSDIVTVKTSGNSMLSKIDNNVFYNCSSLESAMLPGTVRSIGVSAFYNCTTLRDVTLPDRITKINCGMFEGCRSLSSLNIPQSVTQICDSAFTDCVSFTDIKLRGDFRVA